MPFKRVQILLSGKLPGPFNLIKPLQRAENGYNVSHLQCVLTLVTLWLWNNQTFRQGASISVKKLILVGTESRTNLNYRMLQVRSAAVKNNASVYVYCGMKSDQY